MSDVIPDYEPPTFTVHIECDVEMTVGEIWPDGDGPKDPTAEDVAEAMERTNDGLRNFTRKKKVLEDWCLLEDDFMEVWVSGPGMDEALATVKVWDHR